MKGEEWFLFFGECRGLRSQSIEPTLPLFSFDIHDSLFDIQNSHWFSVTSYRYSPLSCRRATKKPS